MTPGADQLPPSDDEARGRLLDGATGTAMFGLDTDGRVMLWPSPAHDLYGYPPDRIRGEPLETLRANRAQFTPTDELLTAARDGPQELSGWHERADGSVFWSMGTISPLRDAGGAVDGYVVACRDTTEAKQYERMLERQNDRLKEFTDVLSHDLRSPLNVIEGRLRLYSEEKSQDHLDAIATTTARMQDLIEDLLAVAEQGRVVNDPQPTDIGPLVERAAEGVLPEGTVPRYRPVPQAMADPQRLLQLFENLLRNTIDHGGDDVAIKVGPLADGFYVEDDGPGIAEADRSEVFAHGFTTRADGHGYGLSIVRSIVGAHGWDIDATAAADGGARFEITGIEFVDDATQR